MKQSDVATFLERMRCIIKNASWKRELNLKPDETTEAMASEAKNGSEVCGCGVKRKRGESGAGECDDNERKRKYYERAAKLYEQSAAKDSTAAIMMRMAAREVSVSRVGAGAGAGAGDEMDGDIMVVLRDADDSMTSYQIPAGELTGEEMEALDTLVNHRCTLIPHYIPVEEREKVERCAALLAYVSGHVFETVCADRAEYEKIRPAQYIGMPGPKFSKFLKWERPYRDIVRGKYVRVYMLDTFE